MNGNMRVSVVATGIESAELRQQAEERQPRFRASRRTSRPNPPHRRVAAPKAAQAAALSHRRASVEAGCTGAANPTTTLRAASRTDGGEVSSRQPNFVPPPAQAPSFTRESQPEAAEDRGPSIFDRVRGLAFSRPAAEPVREPVTQTRRVASGRPESRNDEDKPRKDEMGDIPRSCVASARMPDKG
ncbi:MAG: hypothetical protein R3C97_15305 [Geminicoccaceae bacterium]